uniref:Putative plasmid-related protein n=1 Tax=Erwinia amylovora ATCC BAA-2158 TaxID=889211 RepID=E5B9D8_ERWAM|nr:putative plasmid-related protein [Erwinia amylovora ATCC BAA-2158]
MLCSGLDSKKKQQYWQQNDFKVIIRGVARPDGRARMRRPAVARAAAPYPHGGGPRDWQDQSCPMPPIAMPDKTCERVIGALSGGGVICVRQYGAQVPDWLQRHFNLIG